MNPKVIWQRALLLFNQQRWELAEREFRILLGETPNDAQVHALLAIVLSQLDRLDNAAEHAQLAIASDPEFDFGYHALSQVRCEQHKLVEAATAIERAIELAPDDPEHFARLAQIRLAQQRMPDALQAADRGLAEDPQHTDCLNLRSLALTKLGRKDEANATVEASLARDPENPYTHQAQGFAKLQQGKGDEAVRHFQEALRRDPTLDSARSGLVEAIKTKNPLYRWVLAPFLWIERYPAGRQTQILIGAWLAAQIGRRSLAGAGYETAANVVGYSWLGVVLLTACIVPLFNLMLLLHPVGRHALDRWAKGHAILLGGVLAIVVAMFVGNAMTDSHMLTWARWLALPYLLPIASLGMFFSGWGRRVMLGICIGLPCAAIWWAVQWNDVITEFHALTSSPVAIGMEGFKQRADAAKELHGTLVLITVLSTWFALLAPKGHRPRRRR